MKNYSTFFKLIIFMYVCVIILIIKDIDFVNILKIRQYKIEHLVQPVQFEHNL